MKRILLLQRAALLVSASLLGCTEAAAPPGPPRRESAPLHRKVEPPRAPAASPSPASPNSAPHAPHAEPPDRFGSLPEWSGPRPEGWSDCALPGFVVPSAGRFRQVNQSKAFEAILAVFDQFAHTSPPKASGEVEWNENTPPEEPVSFACADTTTCERFAELVRRILQVEPKLSCGPLPRTPTSPRRFGHASSESRCAKLRACELASDGITSLPCEEKLLSTCGFERDCATALTCARDRARSLPPAPRPLPTAVPAPPGRYEL